MQNHLGLNRWNQPLALSGRARHSISVLCFVLPVLHPLLIPAVGVPSHLLWLVHVLPAALIAYYYGRSRAALFIGLSITAVIVGERLLGRGYGVAADWQTAVALAVATALTNMLVAGFALHAKGVAEQLRQTQKMEALGQLAGGIAHDFNNLLTAIRGHTILALELIPAGRPERHEIEEIGQSSARAAALTRQLLAFSRKQALTPCAFSINTVIRNLTGLLRRLIGENIELQLELGAGDAFVYADPGQIEQAIVNLVVNARDAMPKGGLLQIITVTPDQWPNNSDPIAHAQRARLNHVLILVIDTGTGMSREVQSRIFEPFFTTKPVGQGTGLGLSTVYGIVQQSGGTIRIQSEPGCGTTFEIALPLAKEAPRATVVASELPAPKSGEETILLVEDEDAVRRLTHRILARSGYKVLVAANADVAIRLARQYEHKIDLLLSDLVMPGKRGDELARELLTARPELRVMFTSGYSAHGDHVTADLPGRLLEKPFEPDQLLRAVRAVLDAPSYPETRVLS